MKEYNYVKTRREDVTAIDEKHIPAVRFVMKRFTRLNIAVFRMSGGRLMKTFPGSGAPICVVTTRGAKTGKKREIALIHLPHGENKLLVASQGGMEKHPIWYYNVKANPDLRILADGVEKDYTARQVDDEEKAALWPHLLSIYPDFDEYQARTDRNIPVFCCEPLSPD